MATQMVPGAPVRTPPSRIPACASHADRDRPRPAGAVSAAPDAAVEGKLAKLQAQFEQLKAQVRQAQQLSSLGTTAAMIAHEVNNLLTPILAYAKSSLAADDVELQRKALTVTVQNIEMLTAMSDRLLEISAAKPTRLGTLRIRGVVEAAARCLCRDFSKDGIEFSVHIDDALTVRADRLQLLQVFFNLLLNARDATARTRRGRITVSAARRNESVVVDVHNTGSVVPPDLLPHIFEPFATSKPSTGDGPRRCSGLGLALCLDLVKENGGSISATSDHGRGTTFRIELPAAAAPEAAAV